MAAINRAQKVDRIAKIARGIGPGHGNQREPMTMPLRPLALDPRELRVRRAWCRSVESMIGRHPWGFLVKIRVHA
jgi:hypothetical protein